MKTLTWLSASVALGLGSLAPSWSMAAGTSALNVLLVSDVVAQAGKAKPTGDRKEVDALLIRARKALKAGEFETADALISEAEKQNVAFSMFYLGDTPKKARAAWTAAQHAGKRKAVERPSQKFEPQMPLATEERSASATEPVEIAEPATPSGPKESLDPNQEAPLVLPDSGGRLSDLSGAQRAQTAPDDDAGLLTRPARKRAIADTSAEGNGKGNPQLLAARRALATGDVRRATAAVEAARQVNMNYALHDDTPDKVEAAIRDYRQVMELLNARQDSDAARHQLANLLMDQAAQLIRWNELDEAERLASSVKSLRVNYNPFDVKPDSLLEKIAVARRKQGNPATEAPATPVAEPAGQVAADGAAPAAPFPAAQAAYEQARDTTRNAPASAEEDGAPQAEAGDTAENDPSAPIERLPTPTEEARPIQGEQSTAAQLIEAGETALRDRDLPQARKLFREAYAQRDTLDPATAQRLQDHLQLLAAPEGSRPAEKPKSLIDGVSSQQQLLAKQLSADVAQKQIAAGKIREKDPKKAMELLKEARAAVEASGVDPQIRTQLLRRVDRSVEELDKYVNQNRAQIELDAANKEVLKDVDRRRTAKIEVDEKLAKLVDEFNKLMDEERWSEAEVVAKRARELDPDNPLAKQIVWHSRLASRTQRNQSLIDDKENLAWKAFDSVEQSAKPFDDREPYLMPDAKKWDDLTKTRAKRLAENRSRHTERELDIERKLKTPVSLKFRNRPLSEVLDQLAKLAAVNLHLDEKGLEEEGISSDTPVTIDLNQDISLKSALNLILEPKHLSYVIKDEVLKVTSEQLRDGEIYPVTYNVADLVIPIPNFVPNGRTGLAGALSEGYNMTGGAWGGMGGAGTGYLASQDGSQATGIVDPKVLAQMNQLMPNNMGSRPAAGPGQSVPFGAGGMGGGAQPDFDTLIDLITTTVKPQTWDEVGGPGSVSKFPNNLSLVISQTQDVHEEIVALLEQLRKNQDLQVTIEVRFITLNDNFFEQIGVDFQANITNNLNIDPRAPGNQNAIVGLQEPASGAPFPNFTSNLDIPFRQNSFNLATPQFGTPANVANFGFAILSDLEAYLLVNASQGDRRSNVLQAPKVTMFNGQSASVFDTTQSPFVISVIPVVGDFAAAYQPVITVLSEGTALTVQAVISSDRRFVRLTVIPFFSQIGEVKEFTFSGTKTTSAKTTSDKATGTSGDSTSASDDAATTSDGVTVQLPNFSIVTVNTTVSVPDGGTVLLGGIKRLSEGRNEFGVPILSKLPYINRLFKNIGIGRETQSLMMMVTPRIIIQEEEEERLGIQTPTGP